MNLNATFQQLLTERPELAAFFKARGLPADPADARAARITVASALKYLKTEPQGFARDAEAFLENRAAQLAPEGDPLSSRLLIRIPCVVQLPLEEALMGFIAREAPELTASVALVEFGADWLKNILRHNAPEIIVGAGIEGMLGLTGLWERYHMPLQMPLNRDYAGMEDPLGQLRLLFGIPLVFVADERRLEGREAPRGFGELLSGAWHKRVVYPDDGEMLNSILLYYFDRMPGDGVATFRDACVASAHPSQMIKYKGIAEKPAVMIMPYIFARIKAKEPGMRVIWPEEGAPILPVVMTVRRDASEAALQTARFLAGPEFGRIVRDQGFFPSSSAGVENNLPGPIRFPAWDELRSAGLASRIPALKRRFLEGDA